MARQIECYDIVFPTERLDLSIPIGQIVAYGMQQNNGLRPIRTRSSQFKCISGSVFPCILFIADSMMPGVLMIPYRSPEADYRNVDRRRDVGAQALSESWLEFGCPRREPLG
jgi:hypothetical protein